jgi:microcystin degradation protein MlrC
MSAAPERFRVAVGSIMQETNSFSPLPTTLDVFRSYYVHHGDELLTGYGAAQVEVPAIFATLRAAGCVPVPLVAAYAAAAGTVTRDCFETLVTEMEERLRAAGPVNGLILALHGALVVEDQPDGDGEIIARMRAILPKGVPIAVSLDLHAHVTPLMLKPSVFHVGYRNYPHTDIPETGTRVAALMVETLAGRRRPVMALAKAPMVVPAVAGRTTDGPLAEVAAAARAAEASGEVLHASIFPVQPWIDAPDLGFAALVCADGDTSVAQRVAERLCAMAWDRRGAFELGLTALADAIVIGLCSDGLTLVSDTGDAPTGGAYADSAAVLRGLIEGGAVESARLSLLTLCDAPAAAAAQAAGVGAELTLPLGHTISTADGTPVTVTARIVSVSDGTYVLGDAGNKGLRVSMGPTAVFAIGGVRLLVRSQPSMEWDTEMYRSQGLEPAEAALCFVKSPSHFRASFGPLARRILLADTPGPTRADLRALPYRRVTRPLWPLDEM